MRQKDFGIWKPSSWAEYWRACRVGLGCALGLAPGGRVAIVSENRIEWLLTQMGAGAVGAVAVGVYATSPAEEMGYVLEHADIELVVRDQEQVDKVLQVPTAAGPAPHRRDRDQGLRSYAVAERARIVTFAQVEEDGQRREDLEQGRWMRRWTASAWPISG